MFNRVTPEGYFADARGSLDWVVPDDEADRDGAEGMSSTDLMLFGRKTYEAFASFWPHVKGDAETAPDPHHAGRTSPTMRAFATWLNETPKLVYSRTLREASWQSSRVVPELVPGEIKALKQQPGKDIIVFGSGSLVSQLTEHGLIDEYAFLVCPKLLGAGRPLFTGSAASTALALTESKAYASGNVMLRYARATPPR